MKERADFLKECMNDPALVKASPMPLDVFNRSYCLVCGQRSCSRSALNGMAFDSRAANWVRDLFDEVPRADDSDANYDRIRQKRFLPIHVEQPGPAAEVWTPARNAVVLIEEPEVQRPEAPADSPVGNATPPSPPEPAVPGPTPSAPEFENTPFAQGTVLPGGPVQQPQQAGKDVVLGPGGTFTFGSDE